MPRIEFATDCDRRAALEILLDSFCECYSCNELVSHDNSQYIDNENFCSACAEDANYCCSCNESSFADHTYVDGDSYCDDCRDNECYEDEDGEWHHGERPEISGDDIGTDASPEFGPVNRPVYSGVAPYHQDPIRGVWHIPQMECIGVEIETYAPDRNSLANSLRGQYACAAERDGSLDYSCGVEIITPPTRVESIAELLFGISGQMTIARCDSWKKSNDYGVHVNLDAREWSDARKRKMCSCFGPANKFWLVNYAARETTYANYARSNECELIGGAYPACKVHANGRVELRIFKSSRKFDTLLSYVRLAQDIARFTLCEEFNPLNLLPWLRDNASPETIAHFAKRDI